MSTSRKPADTKTQFAQHGDVGTQVLKPLPGYTPPMYKVGGTIETVWSMRNNHGGGYAYRLCPLPEGNFTELTEGELYASSHQKLSVYPV